MAAVKSKPGSFGKALPPKGATHFACLRKVPPILQRASERCHPFCRGSQASRLRGLGRIGMAASKKPRASLGFAPCPTGTHAAFYLGSYL